MKNHLKRLLATVMAVVVILCAAPVNGFVGLKNQDWLNPYSVKAQAASTSIASGSCGDSAYWEITDAGVLRFYGSGRIYENNNAIAEYYQAYKKYSSRITSVIVESGIENIPSFLFYELNSAKTISIPASVSDFSNSYTFLCKSLEKIIVDSNNPILSTDSYGVLYNKDKTRLYQYPTARTATSFTVPSTVKRVDGFTCCTNLKSITLPSSIETIEQNAFSGSGLESVTIPSSVTYLGEVAFSGCKYLKTLICNSKHLGYRTFSGCSALTSVTLNYNYTSIPNETFYGCSSLTTIKLPTTITSIGSGAFKNCTNLTTINLPSGLTYIDGLAFYGCSSLSNINLPDTVTYIGYGAFNNTNYYNNDSNWQNNVLYLGTNLLDAKVDLSGSYQVRAGTTVIAEQAFRQCSNLKEVNIPGTVVSTGGSWAFYKSGIQKIIINKGKLKKLPMFEGCSNLTYLQIPANVNAIIGDADDSPNLVIYCYDNPPAEKYAKDNNISYVSLGPVTYSLSFDPTSGTGAPQPLTGNTTYTIPSTIPKQFGWNFDGWYYTGEDGYNQYFHPGDQITLTEDLTLRASWGGSGFSKSGMTISSSIDDPGEIYYQYHTPSTSGKYVFCSIGDEDTYGYLYDSNGNLLASNDDGGTGSNFRIEYNLTAGTKYYYGIKYYSSSKTGRIYCNFGPVYTISFNANGGSGAPSSQYKDWNLNTTLSTTKPTRNSYRFLGWSKSSTAVSVDYLAGDTVSEDSNLPLYAVWQEATNPTGSISSTNDVAPSQTVTIKLSDNAGIAGYYWGTSSTYTSNTYTAISGAPTSKTVTIVVTAAGTYYLTVKDTSGNVSTNYSITFYKTTLNANGGSVSPPSVLTKSGNSFTFPTPTRSGYTCNGWSTSSSSSSGVYSLTPTSNTTYYATWVDSAKPTGSISTTNYVSASQTVTFSFSDNVGIAGYYWGTSSTYTNNTYTATSSTSVTKTISSAGTYYLTVKDTSGNVSTNYSITFYNTTLNANGGSVSPTSVLTKSGSTFTLPTPTKDKCSYIDWNEKQDGSGASYKGIYTVSANKTLYAQYHLDYHTVSFNANGGKNAPNPIEYNINLGITLPSEIPVKEYTISYNANGGTVSKNQQKVNCKFEGWDTNPSGTGTRYQAGKFYKSDNDETLYAQWSNQSAGTLESATRTGYTFKGWYTATSGGTKITGTTIFSGDTNVYSQWTPNEYTVTFDAKGGTCSPTSKKVTFASTYGTLPTPTRNGYTFLGWYDSSNSRITSTSQVNAASNHTLTAKWSPKTYTITFNANGGTCTTANKSVVHDDIYGELPQATWSGYSFKGWFTQSTGGKQIVSSSIVDGTVTTLYAQWTLIPTYTITFDANGGKNPPNPQIKTDGVDLRLTDAVPTKQYTITFNANGGNVSSNSKTIAATFGSWIATDGTAYDKGSIYKKNEATTLKAKWSDPQAGTLPNPTKDGYQFDGWYSGNTKFSSITKVTANTTLTAHWKANTYTVSFYNGIDFLGSTIFTYDIDGKLTYGSIPVRSGYTFVGWEFSEDKKLYQEGQAVKNLTKENGKTLVFQAAWKKQIVLEDLTYSFYNNDKPEGFGYPEDYIIPRDSYYLMFGQNILSKTLIGNAELLKAEKGITWGGNCFGMSTTTGLFNSQSEMNIADFNEFAMHVSDLRINNTSPKINNRTLTQYIESMQVSQYYSYIQRDYKENKNKISELCKLIAEAETSGKYPIIALFGPEGGHAVVGYHVEKISNSETWIHIYDCNYPSTLRHITLYTNAKGEYTGWRYNIAEKYDDWTSTLKKGDDCSISYVPYEHFKLAWEYRGRASELAKKMKIEGVDANGDILALNSTNFVVKDFDGNTVCKAANGQFTSYDSEVYELMIAEISTANGYLLMLPADYYTVENKDKNLKSLELRIVNTDLGATVSTSADKVSIAVSDEYDVNNIVVNAGKGEKYELNLLSSMNNGYETITLSGIGDGSSIGLSCTQGQVNYSIHNSTGVTLTINGEQYNLNQGQPKTIKSVSVMSKPEKLTYQYKSNNKIDTTGLSLLVNYTDGTSEVVTDSTKFTCEGLNTKKAGKQTITIIYEGNTTSYDVQVRYAWWQKIIRILLLGFLWY